MQGELYYETTMAYFSGDPWVNQSAFGGTGDGTLFYPGTPAKIGGSTEIPVESIRLKAIRDGMEDYELLHLAKTLGLGAQALQIARGVYPNTYTSTTSPAALDSARAQLAALILHAMGKDVQAPPAGGGGGAPSCDTTACTTPDTGAAVPVVGSGVGGGGCSSPGVQSTWLAIPALAMFALGIRRRRRALAKVRR
jgi:MYXO-CTERM domain-containing protein